MLITAELLRASNERLRDLEPVAILRTVHATFGSRAAILSSMQRAGTVLCHMADRAKLGFDVLFVDTGVLHQETLATRDTLVRTHENLRVVTLSPTRTFAEQTRDEGLLYLTKEGQERCCELRKSEPLASVKGRYHVIVGALRRSESGRRDAVEIVSLDPDMGALRVHPFAYFSNEALADYLRDHDDVALNPLHAMGFPTIGCFPCTTPVLPDEPERAGRWRHLAGVTYCGINPTDTGRATSIETDDRYEVFFSGSATPSSS